MSTLDDEFDNLPGDFCQSEGIDWDRILPVPFLADGGALQHDTGQSPSADSSQYSCDDDDLDPAFFAELDNLEKEIVQSQQGPSSITLDLSTRRSSENSLSVQGNDGSSDMRSSDSIHLASFHENTGQLITSSSSFRPKSENSRSPSRKRVRESSPLKVQNKKGKEKARENENVWQVLSGIEDELSCPICSDIFVAAHLCNPCGHSVCGECGWQWKRKGKTSCAICRTELARDMPMIPNFAMDNTVEKHVAALGKSGVIEWKVGGSKHVEWLGRKEQWRKSANERTKTRVPEKQSNQSIFVWEILDDDELGEVEYVSDGVSDGGTIVWSRRRRAR